MSLSLDIETSVAFVIERATKTTAAQVTVAPTWMWDVKSSSEWAADLAQTDGGVAGTLGFIANRDHVLYENSRGTLGETTGSAIVIDDNGAGLGWSTRVDEVESGQYDLLTAIVHELSHAIGRDHSDEGLMLAVLNPGVRARDIDDFFARDIGDLLS